MPRSPSSPVAQRSRQFVVVGTPGDRRVALFATALEGQGLAPPLLVPWTALLDGTAHLRDYVTPGTVVRIESPGKDAGVRNAFAAAGANIRDPLELAGAAELSGGAADEPGRLHGVRRWFLGFGAALDRIAAQLAVCPPHRTMADPHDIQQMFDKPRCHARLKAAGVPVPRALGSPRSFAELTATMREARCSRVFVKLAHGSSATGVVAYQVRGAEQQATTTAEIQRSGGELRLYNSRRIRTYRDPAVIAALMDALCQEHVHVEQWLPKAGLCERTFDLRVVVIAGQARHAVARLSQSPLTNLHLLNARGAAELVRERMGPAAWRAALETCERAAATVPRSLHVGVDLLITPDFRRHAVLELNAFGDLLPGILDAGQGTYAAEIAAVLGTPAVAGEGAPAAC